VRRFSGGLVSASVAMALVAVHTVVDVAVHTLMLLIRVGLSVTIRALEHRVVARICVACRADSAGSAVPHVEPGMVEDRARPSGDHLVARLTRCGKARRDVIRIVRTLIFRFVARIAIGRKRSVVVVHVAASARDLYVCPYQGESRVVMVERCRLPRRRAVTDVALLGKSPGHVIWITRALVVLHVAANTGSVGQVVVAIGVAIAALQFQVPSRQGKAAFGMIERGRLPRGSTVAHRAVRRKTRRYVVRIRCFLVILHVAAHARSVGQLVVAVDVAVAALQLGVGARDRETYRSMIETRRLPCGRAVAVLACLRETERNVIRICGFAEIRRVTPDTIGGRPFVLATSHNRGWRALR